MVQNERQYKVTKGQIAKLEGALKSSRDLCGKMDPRVFSAMIGGIEWEINRLQQQLYNYEELKVTSSLTMHSVEELSQILVKARIARGYTQKELAERVGVKPQQIQKYEVTGYRSASWKRILEVMDALGLDFEAHVPLKKGSTDPVAPGTFITDRTVLKEGAGVDIDRTDKFMSEYETDSALGVA
jgi:HTH-type transcriptional regulator/antitoxin HigA